MSKQEPPPPPAKRRAVALPIASAMERTSELERFKGARTTALFRLELIAKGAQIAYEDGTPIDMASEKARLEEVVADMDRRIARIELANAKPTGPLN